MAQEIAVVGSDLFTLGFKLAGVRRAHVAAEPAALNQAVQQILADDSVGILVMETGDVGRLDGAIRRRLEEGLQPTLVGIGLGEDTGLRDKLKQAIGVDVWK